MTPSNSAELLLHPVRLRIVQTLLGERRLTTAQLQVELHDVTPATLYRQVRTLLEGGVLDVVQERRVRGAVERTYALRTEAASVRPEDLAGLTAEEHRGMFATFAASLLADFDRYLASGEIDLVADGVGYRQHAFWLSDEELARLGADLSAALLPYALQEPAPGRVRRLFSTVVMPGRDGAEIGPGEMPTTY